MFKMVGTVVISMPFKPKNLSAVKKTLIIWPNTILHLGNGE